ncbi:hypothetical protein LSCM1_04948 [Leishmania martiniquensis]|uniref:Reverse transcriptase domain-containing protein n=1 Tax=Leishmania martiniquensis TaxID=1580590 RepID=A0A836HIV7_9TRYP|nr:hypothetical protein LSCM1_04948 [Leishmania martiniquensis]
MGRGVAGGPRGPHTLAARTAVDAKRPAGLRPGKGGHPPDRASGSGAELAVVYHLQGPGVRQGRAAEPPPVHKPGGRIRFVDLTGVPGGGHRDEALREGVGDAPTRPAAGGGDAAGLQGALPHPPARRALPEAGVALRRTSGRPGDTPDKGRAHLRTLGELADGLSEYHDPLWKGCEVPRALCDRDAIAARGRGPAAEAGEKPRPNAAPVCGRDEPPRSGASSAAPREPCGGPPIHPEGCRTSPGSERRIRGGPHADHRPHASGHAQAVPGLWPPANEGGRCRAGKRRASPPRIDQLGWEAPTAKSLGVSDAELYAETRRMQGLPPVATLPDGRQWPLHLKRTTPLDLAAVREMPTAHSRTKRFLEQAIQYMNPRRFVGLRTSRTVRTASLPLADVLRAVGMGKFERCDWQPRHPASRRPLPEGVRGVNTFSVPEMKGRRRLITEPHLNALVSKRELPKVEHPTRQWRRQELRYARYMFQLDFVTFYDAIPLPEEMRNTFVFRARDHVLYRCCTLPTGARWSVAVGQAVTWTIVDIDTPVTVFTMIDNMLIAAREGQERAFLSAVRRILARIRTANLLTSPDRETVAAMSDEELLSLARADNTFLGEDFHWNGSERVVRNALKTVAKLKLALRATRFSCRSFASLASLVMYAMHTTRLNPAEAFPLQQAYRAMFRLVERGRDWDDEVPYVGSNVLACLQSVGGRLVENEWWRIADRTAATYEDGTYDAICFTDASADGWGAVVRYANGTTDALQQRWATDLHPKGRVGEGSPRTRVPDPLPNDEYFTAKHSAHAEPRAAMLCLQYLMAHGLAARRGPTMRMAVVTDHFAIVRAQRKHNGFGGIGRGYCLNRLYAYTTALYFTERVRVVFFYIAGQVNPADELSRNFADDGGTTRG